MPYLRIFHPELGTSEVVLHKPRLIVGREREYVEHVLPDPGVSRMHAIFLRDHDGCSLVDCHSSAGTVVNQARITHVNLAQGDTIQMGGVTLEYRTDDDTCFELTRHEVRDDVERYLRQNFRLLPVGIDVTYRTVEVKPLSIFAAGDTISIGQGGILVPNGRDLHENQSIEVSFKWPDGRGKTLMGEVVGIVEVEERRMPCVKLHQVPDELYRRHVRNAPHGKWVSVWEAR